MINLLVSWIRILFGLAFVLFIPGFSCSLVVFRKKDFDLLKRISISPVMSVIIIFLTSLSFDLFLGIDITGLNIFIGLSFISVLFLFIWSIQSGNLKKSFTNLRRSKK
jgi:uncharacterized membrane protein